MHICDLLIFIGFPVVFQWFLHFGGCYFHLISVLFSLRFLHRFLVAFWSDFGVILGGFGGSQSIFFGIDFELRFLIVFWSDFGVILGGFWEAFGGRNRSFLASIFILFLNVVPCVRVCVFGRLKVCVCVAPGPSKSG